MMADITGYPQQSGLHNKSVRKKPDIQVELKCVYNLYIKFNSCTIRARMCSVHTKRIYHFILTDSDHFFPNLFYLALNLQIYHSLHSRKTEEIKVCNIFKIKWACSHANISLLSLIYWLSAWCFILCVRVIVMASNHSACDESLK